MVAFLLACVVTIAIAVGAWFSLESFGFTSAREQAAPSVRLGDAGVDVKDHQEN